MATSPMREKGSEQSVDNAHQGSTKSLAKNPGSTSRSRSRKIAALAAILGGSSLTAAAFAEKPASLVSLSASGPRATGPTVTVVTTVASEETSAPKSLAKLEAAVASATKPIPQATALLALGEQTLANGKPEIASEHFARAIKRLGPKSGDPRLFAKANYDYGLALLLAGRGNEAAEPLNRALAIRERLRVPTADIGATISMLVWAEREAGNLPGAVTLAKKQVDLARTGKGGLDLPLALEAQGVTLVSAGNVAGSLAPLRESVAGREATKGAPLGSSLHSLGWALMTLGRYDEAIPPLRRAVAVRSEIAPQSNEVASSLLLLAWAERETKDYKRSTADQKRLVEVTRQGGAGGPGTTTPDALDGLGVTEVLGDESLDAVRTLTESVTLRSGPDTPALANSLHLLGWAQIQADDAKAAAVTLRRAIDMRTRLGLTKDADQSRVLLGGIK
jgi:tetratricopeptide (TPR) repeat protein